MAKRNGRGGDVVEMELDLEVGWACQLQSQGTKMASTVARGRKTKAISRLAR